MIRLGTGLVLGFHGCPGETAERLLAGAEFQPSDNLYDWLGPGAYFWEGDLKRAQEWATERRYKSPAVVGAVIDLAHCLDLTTRGHIDLLAAYFELFKQEQERLGEAMPVNEDLQGDLARDKLKRFLDRAVIHYLHNDLDKAAEIARSEGHKPDMEPFDTVRGMFPEGDPAFPGAGFLRKTHTQIAVRNLRCIKGVFRPKELE